jgi:hypothetical protein
MLLLPKSRRLKALLQNSKAKHSLSRCLDRHGHAYQIVSRETFAIVRRYHHFKQGQRGLRRSRGSIPPENLAGSDLTPVVASNAT